MNTTQILIQIHEEIARLQQVKLILTGGSISTPKRGRPAATPKKRTLSPEARARIAAAQKKRWAAQKKAK